MDILDGFEKVKIRRICKDGQMDSVQYIAILLELNTSMFSLFIKVQNFLKLCKSYHIKNINAPGRHGK